LHPAPITWNNGGVASAVSFGFLTRWPPTFCAALLSMNAVFGADLVSDDAIKIEILKAAFPNSRVSVSKQKPLDWKPFAMAGTRIDGCIGR
jgi:hypothetical protein